MAAAMPRCLNAQPVPCTTDRTLVSAAKCRYLLLRRCPLCCRRRRRCSRHGRRACADGGRLQDPEAPRPHHSQEGGECLTQRLAAQPSLRPLLACLQEPTAAQDLLTALGRLPISLEILTKTRIGFTVNALRKSIKHDEATSTVAKELIKRWKKLIDNKEAASAAATGACSSSSNGSQSSAAKSATAPVATKAAAASGNNVKKPPPAPTLLPRSSVPLDSSADGIRCKCREMLATALSTPLPESFAAGDEADIGDLAEPDRVAEQIEQAIFREFRNIDNRYRNRVRSRVANLKDNRNPDLRLNVLKGIISAERIATMDAVVSCHLACHASSLMHLLLLHRKWPVKT